MKCIDYAKHSMRRQCLICTMSIRISFIVILNFALHPISTSSTNFIAFNMLPLDGWTDSTSGCKWEYLASNNYIACPCGLDDTCLPPTILHVHSHHLRPYLCIMSYTQIYVGLMWSAIFFNHQVSRIAVVGNQHSIHLWLCSGPVI